MTKTIPKVPLKDVAELIRGVTYKGEQASDNPFPDSIPILRATNIQDGIVTLEQLVHIPAGLVKEAQILKRDDIVIAASSGSRNIVGKAAHIGQQSSLLSFGAFLFGLRPSKYSNAKYISHYLQTREYREEISKMAAGININNLKRDHLLEFPIPIAPLPEQQRIADAIDSYFSRLDAAQSSLERAQQKLKAYRASVLKAAVAGRLVPTEAEIAREEGREYEPASELLERILKDRRKQWEAAELEKFKAKGQDPKSDKWKAKYKEPVAPDTSNLPELPEGWCWATVDQVISEPLRNGHSAPATKGESGIRTLTLSAVTNHDFSENNTKLTTAEATKVRDLWLKAGDILIERSNTIELVGTAALYEGPEEYAIFPDLMIRARFSRDLPPQFMELVLLSPYSQAFFRSRAQGVAGNMPKIDQGTVERLSVPLPPINEIERILLEYSRLDSSETSIDGTLTTSASRLKRLRQCILRWAFEGKLVDQDPNDEPAAELLKRIRAAREEAKVSAGAKKKKGKAS